MGKKIDNDQNSDLRSRLRGYQPRATQRVERRPVASQIPVRNPAPAILKTVKSPVKPLIENKQPISASRFYMPKQRRSKVLRRRGLQRFSHPAAISEQYQQSPFKVILIILLVCSLLVASIILLTNWQSHRLVRPQTALKLVDRLYNSGV